MPLQWNPTLTMDSNVRGKKNKKNTTCLQTYVAAMGSLKCPQSGENVAVGFKSNAVFYSPEKSLRGLIH